MPRKKKTETKQTVTHSKMRTLNEILDELETYRAKYGNRPVVSFGETMGEYNGKTNPHVLHIRVSADECKPIYFASTTDKVRKVVD